MIVCRTELAPAARAEARPPPGTAVWAIGDVHGRSDLLEALLDAVRDDAGRRAARRRVLVYVGDYVSRGLDSRRVVELVRRAPDGFEVVALKGNHEDLLLHYLEGDLSAGRHWFDFDGLDALAHYGVETGDGAAHDDATLEALRRAFARALPADHLAFFRSLAAARDEGGYRFVHGGVRPGVALAAQTDADQMWIRGPFLASGLDHGAVVVHGHSISPEVDVRPNRIGIDTGAYRSGVLTCLVLDGAERAVLRTGAGPERAPAGPPRQGRAMERVILVDESDREVGTDEKAAAHAAGRLHRAFSIFVFDGTGRLLLQRRAAGKYHSAGRWSNTCCGHPRPGEALEAAAHRRLREEMGFDCRLVEVARYRYTAHLDGGLVENEIDHLFAGEFDGAPSPDPAEAASWRWADPRSLLHQIGAAPRRFTAWFRGSLERVLEATAPAARARAAHE